MSSACYIDWYTAGSPIVDPNWWEDAFEHPRRIGKANPDLTKATDQGTADVTWTAGIVAGDIEFRNSHATGVKNYQTVLADIERDLIVAQAPLDEAHTLGYLAAQTAYWTAEVAAASARRTAEATAIANWRGADYGASASALAGIDTAMELPWTGYLADKAAALAAWWINDEHDNFLALTTATNTAETTYQTTVNTALTTWAVNTAAAEKTFTIADASANYDQQVLNFAADEAYEHGLAAAEGTWQNGKAANLKTRRVDYWTARRDEVVNQVTASTLPPDFEMVLMMPDPADEPLDRAYTVAESTAHGTRRVGKATAWRDYVGTFNTAILPYVNTTATADENYTVAESTAAALRTAAIAAAISDHDIIESQSLTDAIEALALASETPWAAHDAALASANEDFTASVAPARQTRDTTLANSERDFEIATATGQRTLTLASEADSGDQRLSLASADRERAIAESTAQLAAVQTLPSSSLAHVFASATTSSEGTPSESIPEGSALPAPLKPAQIPPTHSPGNAMHHSAPDVAGEAIPDSLPRERAVNEATPHLPDTSPPTPVRSRLPAPATIPVVVLISPRPDALGNPDFTAWIPLDELPDNPSSVLPGKGGGFDPWKRYPGYSFEVKYHYGTRWKKILANGGTIPYGWSDRQDGQIEIIIKNKGLFSDQIAQVFVYTNMYTGEVHDPKFLQSLIIGIVNNTRWTGYPIELGTVHVPEGLAAR